MTAARNEASRASFSPAVRRLGDRLTEEDQT